VFSDVSLVNQPYSPATGNKGLLVRPGCYVLVANLKAQTLTKVTYQN